MIKGKSVIARMLKKDDALLTNRFLIFNTSALYSVLPKSNAICFSKDGIIHLKENAN